MINIIDGLGSIRTAQPVKRAVKNDSANSAAFATHLGESDDAAPVGGMSSSNAVSGILGAQEVDDALAHASRGKLRAEDILDRLDDLRLQLLAGGISREKLLQLNRIVSQRRGQITDPKLLALLDEIDLRAQVELAKYAPN